MTQLLSDYPSIVIFHSYYIHKINTCDKYFITYVSSLANWSMSEEKAVNLQK